ncbi:MULTISPECIES: hypothetical protein [Weeksellaceae]|uniref:Uncharacterized protein n=1 Tax=Elizabethkingia miricola TaxID=172045 RepID=A0ABD5B861_ELIMR|nr:MULTISPECIES: hypothetical protein [Weeksellaceae]MDQ8750107.1 hypothetical protein [Elizabethkingia miricola]MPS66611.1 hypothetical protein [Chryseobacterium sp.]
MGFKIQRVGNKFSIPFRTIYTMQSSLLPSMFFYPRSQYALLFRFKSKGISVFLTPPQGHASLKKNLHPLGSIYFPKPFVA